MISALTYLARVAVQNNYYMLIIFEPCRSRICL